MAGPWISEADLKQKVADILKKDVGDLDAYWDRHVATARTDGYGDIAARLLGRGYTMSQLDAWDDRVKYNRHQALYWLFVEGYLPTDADDREINKLDHRKELEDPGITLMINGQAVPPGSTDETDGGSVGGGVIDESDYRITTDTEF